MGLSEAEDWLGREASRPSEDPDRGLYRKQAVVKKTKPRTWGEGSRWASPGPPAQPRLSHEVPGNQPYSGQRVHPFCIASP